MNPNKDIINKETQQLQELNDKKSLISAKIRETKDLAEKSQLQKEYNQIWKQIGERDVYSLQSAETTTPVQLDLFPDWVNGNAAMPNTIARSALFASIRPGKRKLHNNVLVASRTDATIRYTGHQLDMADSDTFMQAIRVIEEFKLGENIKIHPYAFLREMGRVSKKTNKAGKVDKIWLESSFVRLATGTLDVYVPGEYRAIVHLIDEYIHNEQTDTYYLRMNPKIINLFKREQYGLIDWEARKKMAVPLAKWLQTYVASNKKGKEHKITLEKLKSWCGQANRPMSKFRIALNKGITELLKLKVIETGFIKNDLFHYKRSPKSG